MQLKTANDSLSYVSGMAMTNGLRPFLMQNFGVSEDDLPAVVEGFKAAIAERKNPKSKAFHAGEQIADMVVGRMLPGLQKEFTIGKDSLNEDVLFEGFIASLNNDTTYYRQSMAEKIFEDQRKAYKNRADSINKQQGEAFLAENKTKDGVITLPSGLQYKVLKKGEAPFQSSMTRYRSSTRARPSTERSSTRQASTAAWSSIRSLPPTLSRAGRRLSP